MIKVRPIYILYGLIILLVNLLLKIWFIESNDIAHDEPFTLFFAQGSPSEIIENLKPYNNPPLYEILLHYWISWFGIEPFAARMLSCIFSSLASVALFYFVLKYWNWQIALSSALLFTFSTFQISFAHEARAYSLFVLLTILSIHFLIAVLDEKEKKMNWFLYILFTFLLLYTHFFSWWVILIEIIILLKRRMLFSKLFLILGSIIFLFYLPYFFILIERFSESAAKGTWVEPPTIDALYENIRHFSNKPATAIIFLGIIIFGIYYFIKKKISFQKSKLDLVLIWFFVPYFLMFLLSFSMPMFLGRYLIFITPAFFILISIFWLSIWEKYNFKNLILFFPTILMLLTINLSPSNELEPSKVSQLIQPFYKNQIPIILAPVSNDIVIAYHLDKDLFTYRENYREYEKNKNFIPENDVRNLKLPNEIIFVETPNHYLDKERNNLNFLISKYQNYTELKFEGNSPKGFEVFHFIDLK